MSRLSGTNDQADIALLHNELGNSTAADVIGNLLTDGTINTKNLPQCVKKVQQASLAREANRIYEQFPNASAEQKRGIAKQLNELLTHVVSTTSTTAVVRTLSTVEARLVDWLWEPYIPKGMLTIVTGDPESGKVSSL